MIHNFAVLFVYFIHKYVWFFYSYMFHSYTKSAGFPSLINWRSENVLFYIQFNELVADGCLQKNIKPEYWNGGRGAEILLIYIQNPKSLPPPNSVFTLIPEELQLHYINWIICIWCGINITNINTIMLDLVLISNMYLTLFCLEVPYVKGMTMIWVCGYARESGYETCDLELNGSGYELLFDFLMPVMDFWFCKNKLCF
jgi:hypothetical protein